MNAPSYLPKTISFELNGETIVAFEGETIIAAAKRHGVEIPHLCYSEGLRPDGNCRACMVEIEGERVLAPSCCRAPKADMKVSSVSTRAVASQKMVLELLLSDMPDHAYKPDDELRYWADKMDLQQPRFSPR